MLFDENPDMFARGVALDNSCREWAEIVNVK